MLKISVSQIFLLNGDYIPIVNRYKYLGHILCNNMEDDIDIDRQYRVVHAHGNSILHKFGMCCKKMKILLFNTFCTSLYTSHLWWKQKKHLLLYVVYNNIIQMICHEPNVCYQTCANVPDVKTQICI